MKQTENDSLDNHLVAVLQSKYGAHGNPIDLQKILNLSPEIWSTLRQDFLD